jgi:hypothetical protein
MAAGGENRWPYLGRNRWPLTHESSPGFDATYFLSTRHQWFARARLRDPHLPRSTARLFPRRSPPSALDRGSSGWFAASACTAAAEGHQTRRPGSSISCAAPHPVIWSSTSSLLQRSCSHLSSKRSAQATRCPALPGMAGPGRRRRRPPRAQRPRVGAERDLRPGRARARVAARPADSQRGAQSSLRARLARRRRVGWDGLLRLLAGAR